MRKSWIHGGMNTASRMDILVRRRSTGAEELPSASQTDKNVHPTNFHPLKGSKLNVHRSREARYPPIAIIRRPG